MVVSAPAGECTKKDNICFDSLPRAFPVDGPAGECRKGSPTFSIPFSKKEPHEINESDWSASTRRDFVLESTAPKPY